jgi:hypothetical protein
MEKEEKKSLLIEVFRTAVVSCNKSNNIRIHTEGNAIDVDIPDTGTICMFFSQIKYGTIKVDIEHTTYCSLTSLAVNKLKELEEKELNDFLSKFEKQ